MNEKFSIFDWPYAVKIVAVTPGGTNQTTGEWVPETTVETAILAHVGDVNQKELSFIDPGIVAVGVRKLSVEQSLNLAVGDRIKIIEADSNESEWTIHAKQNFSGFLSKYAGVRRETFLLKRNV